MIQVLLLFLLICGVFIVCEKCFSRIVIWLGVFSLIAAACFLLLGSPDIGLAEAAITSFSTIFLLVCLEKHYDFNTDNKIIRPKTNGNALRIMLTYIVPFVFVLGLLALFIAFSPTVGDNPYLRDRFMDRFHTDVGGTNAVSAIYLGYRVYDTLFEALILVISVVAVLHLSHYDSTYAPGAERRCTRIERSNTTIFTLRMISPFVLLFGIYLLIYGITSPGGAFQGGVVLASFLICRYLIYDLYDLPLNKFLRLEELIFAAIIILAAFVVFLGITAFFPALANPTFQNIYLTAMNVLLGFKVTCGFGILLFRYVAVERR
ncbi:MAG: DUF4040 domain-containing protein [Oscillospiraceae bacterium]|nr:DUF4040 domain-containing protein [Oscillospiraceae bacterium]